MNFYRHLLIPILLAAGFSAAGFRSDAPDIINIYVSPTGNDAADGSENNPVATPGHALDLLNIYSNKNKISEGHIIMADGVYRLDSTLCINQGFATDHGFKLYIEAAKGSNPVISGACAIDKWTVSDHIKGLPEKSRHHIVEARVPRGVATFRQMWIDGRRLPKASTFDTDTLPRIICRDESGRGLIVPLLNYNFVDAERVEMTIIQDWAMNILRLKSLEKIGNRTTLKFQEPESEIEFKRPWPILRADSTSATNHHFILSNAIEFLDRPGEWYYDNRNEKLYFWPPEDLTAKNLQTDLPVLETLVEIKGTVEKPVRNIEFIGITFSYTAWLRPADYGHVALQAGQYLYDAYSMQTETANNVAWVGRPVAAVAVSNADNISFEDCRFKGLGATALDFVSGVRNAKVTGSVFHDIGGNAISAGYFGDENFECHQAWNPSDSRLICDRITITNNYIDHPGVEDWGTLAIAVGFASNVMISHNEICNTPYSAVNVGWGWVKDLSIMHNNHIIGNYIHSFSNEMRDSGAIYTLSAQPGSSIVGNRIENVGHPANNPVMWPGMSHSQFDLYTDEGSDCLIIKDNWLERGEISKNQNGPNIQWGYNGPNVDVEIKNKAGLEPQYRHIKTQDR